MILRHGATYLLSTGSAALLGLAASVVLTRALGPGAFGVYGLAQSVGTFVLYAGFEWLTWAVAPLLAARAGTDAAVAATVRGMFVRTAVGIAVLGVVALAVSPPAMRGAFAGAFASAVALGYFQLRAQFAVVRLSPARFAAMNGARSLGTFVAVAGAAWLAAPLGFLLAGPGVGAMLGVMVAAGEGRSDARPGGDAGATRAVRRAAFRLGAPLAAVFAIYAVQLSADRWVIEAIAGTARLGEYVAAALTVQAPVALLGNAIGMAGLPLALEAARSGERTRLRAQLRANLALLAGLVTPAAMGLALVASRLLPALLGDAFVASGVALAPWLCAAAWAAGLRANYLDQAFAIGARTRPQIAVMGVLATTQVLGTVALLPLLGLVGAALAEIVANVAAASVSACLGRRVCAVPAGGRDLFAIGVGCAAMAATLLCIPFPVSLAGAIGEIAVGALVYGVIVVCLDLGGSRRWLLARPASRRPVRARAGVAVLGALALLLSLGACGPSVPPNAVLPAPVQPQTARGPYRLQPGDELEVRIYDVPQLDDRVVVRPDGRVSLQLAGDLDAAGHTVDELHDAMIARYATVLKNPQISVIVRSVAPQRVYVDGEVSKPGIVEAPERITLGQAVAEAGGIKSSAEASRVLLIRRHPNEAKPQISVLDLAAVQNGTDPSQDIQLATNDVVFVPRSRIGDLNRWVDIYLRQNIPVQFGSTIP